MVHSCPCRVTFQETYSYYSLLTAYQLQEVRLFTSYTCVVDIVYILSFSHEWSIFLEIDVTGTGTGTSIIINCLLWLAQIGFSGLIQNWIAMHNYHLVM